MNTPKTRLYLVIPLSGLCGALLCLLGLHLFRSALTVDNLFASVPSETLNHLNEVLPWTKNANVKIINRHLVLFSENNDNLELTIVPLERPYFPLLSISQSNITTDHKRVLSFVDVEGRQLSLVDRESDGILNTLTIAVGHGEDKVVLSDRNFSGSFDLRLGPRGTNYFMIDDKWWPFVVSGEKMYVESDKGRREVIMENGTLNFMENFSPALRNLGPDVGDNADD